MYPAMVKGNYISECIEDRTTMKTELFLEKYESLVHPDEVKWIVERIFNYYTFQDGERSNDTVWFRKYEQPLRAYLQRTRVSPNYSRYVHQAKEQRVDDAFKFETALDRLLRNFIDGNFFLVWDNLVRLYGEEPRRHGTHLLKVIAGHEFLVAIGEYTGQLTDEFIETYENEAETVSVDERDEETTIRPGQFMPRQTKAYYHSVVYFKGDANNLGIHQRRAALTDLRNELCKYLNSARPAKGYRCIVADHFFFTDRAVVQYLNYELQSFRGISSFSESESCEPHLHVVHYCTSRKSVGTWRIIDGWTSRNLGGIQTGTKVRNFDLLRQYLYQGRGRVVRCEINDGPVEQGDSSSGDDHPTSSERSADVQCKNDGGDVFCELAGKLTSY
jgi:hypothetical protein